MAVKSIGADKFERTYLELERVAPSGRPDEPERLQASLRGCNAERRWSAGLLGDRTRTQSEEGGHTKKGYRQLFKVEK